MVLNWQKIDFYRTSTIEPIWRSRKKKDRTDSSQETQFFVRLIPGIYFFSEKNLKNNTFFNSIIIISDMRPTTKNIVAHDASNILNREANYFWCSRKANQESGTQTQYVRA